MFMSYSAVASRRPSVDVVIPTLNCAHTLHNCLERLCKQDFTGTLKFIVVDGGSTDNTVDVALEFEAEVFVKKGMHGAGLNGARHYGEMMGKSPFVWMIDSDNLLVEATVATDLVTPLMTDSTLQLSVPELLIDPDSHPLNNYLGLLEIEKVDQMKKNALKRDSCLIIDDMTYGITNATILRRTALELAGGYDGDVRLLRRLRNLRLSRGTIVTTAHYHHNQLCSVSDFRLKWSKRLMRYGAMTESELSNYFLDYPLSASDHSYLTSGLTESILLSPFHSISNYLMHGDKTWLWGCIYPLLVSSLILRHPLLSYRAYRRFI